MAAYIHTGGKVGVIVEVGATNRTRLSDYSRAITENTRLVMRVHPSNYRIIGFTHRPGAEEIGDVARRAGVPSFEDLGSGCLIDLSPFGVKDEPVVADAPDFMKSLQIDHARDGGELGQIDAVEELAAHRERRDHLLAGLARSDSSRRAAIPAAPSIARISSSLIPSMRYLKHSTIT